jgi:GntR family transcriptional regulator
MTHHAVADLRLGNPLYKEVKRKITESLRSGERKAVDELAAENILIRHQGRGTFVASHGRSRYYYSFFHISRQDGHREYPQVELVDFTRRPADADAASALRIGVGNRIVCFRNLLRLEGEPVILDDVAVSASLFPKLTEKLIRQRPSTIYQLYQEAYGVSVVRTIERLRASKATKGQAALLGVAVGHPLLMIVRVALSFRDQPVELRYSYVNTDRYEYRAEPGDDPSSLPFA